MKWYFISIRRNTNVLKILDGVDPIMFFAR
jgi:hypothetical protein